MNYQYKDPDGDTIEVVPSAATGAVRLLTADVSDGERACVTVLAADLPGFVAALYEADGRPAPIILDRPEVIPTDRIPVGSMSVEADGRHVKLVASELNWYRIGDPLRLAAALAAMHDRLEGRRASELASFLNDVWDHDTLAVARELLVRFEVKERAS